MLSLIDLFNVTCERYANKEALVFAERRYTWAQLQVLVGYHRKKIAHLQIKHGGNIALWISNSPDFIACFLAVLAQKAIVCPLNTSLKSGDFALINANFSAILVDETLKQTFEQEIAPNLSDETKVFVIDQDPATRADEQGCMEEIAKVKDVDACLPAVCVYSSGSTGIPQKVVRTHGQCVAEVLQSRQTLAITEKDNIFSMLPLYHSHGMANAFWAAMGSGAKLVLLPNNMPLVFNLKYIVETLQTEQISILPSIPYFFELLASWPSCESFANLRLCYSAGAPLKLETYNAIKTKHSMAVRQLYGCTEAGALTLNVKEVTSLNQVTVGHEIYGVELQIFENGQEVEQGCIGEVAIKSAALADEYFQGHRQLSKYDAGRFFTGDLGKKLHDGSIEIIGRKEFVFDVAGHKVSAVEVETILEQCQLVSEAAVSRCIVGGSPELVAFIVSKHSHVEGDIIVYCKAKLPAYKVPSLIKLVPSLPKSPLGKLQRAKLVNMC